LKRAGKKAIWRGKKKEKPLRHRKKEASHQFGGEKGILLNLPGGRERAAVVHGEEKREGKPGLSMEENLFPAAKGGRGKTG